MLFNKKNNENVKEKTSVGKIHNTVAIKRNIYAVIMSVIFIVAVVFLVAISTMFAKRYPLELDLTTNKVHSINNNNFDYIKNVDAKINIYVLMSEDAYSCKTNTKYDLAYIAAKKDFVEYGPENIKYYQQTVELLKKYSNYNDNIKVEFLDIYYDSKASAKVSGFSGLKFSEGDFLIEGNFQLNGEEVTRRTVVHFDDLYKLEDLHGQAEFLTSQDGKMYQMMYGATATAGAGFGFYITENSVEAAVSSAIYKVTSEKTPVFLIPTSYSKGEKVKDALESVLQINNFRVEYVEGALSVLLTKENSDKYSGIILSECTSDISTDDRAFLEKFLDNEGKKNKSLFFFAGVNTSELTNLCAFLGDWGIGFEPGVLYETDTSYHPEGLPTQMALEFTDSKFTQTSKSLGGICIGENISVMKQLWAKGSSTTATYTRETESILNTASFGKTTVMPSDANIKDWKIPSDAKKDKFTAGIFAQDTVNGENNTFNTSYVIAFASADFISKDFNTNSCGNFNLVLDTFNAASGISNDAFSFVPKTIDTESYRESVTEKKVTVMKTVFMIFVPVALIASGTYVWVRRKRK